MAPSPIPNTLIMGSGHKLRYMKYFYVPTLAGYYRHTNEQGLFPTEEWIFDDKLPVIQMI